MIWNGYDACMFLLKQLQNKLHATRWALRVKDYALLRFKISHFLKLIRLSPKRWSNCFVKAAVRKSCMMVDKCMEIYILMAYKF